MKKWNWKQILEIKWESAAKPQDRLYKDNGEGFYDGLS